MTGLLHITPNLRTAILAYALWSLSYDIIAPLIPLLSSHVGATSVEVGLVATAGVIGAGVLIVPLSLVSDRFGRRIALVMAWLVSGVGMLFMAAAHSVATLIPGVLLSGAVVAALPTLNVLILDEANPDQRTRAYVVFYAAGPAGMLLGSWIGGIASQDLGLSAVALISGVLVLLSTLSLTALRPPRTQTPSPTTAEERRPPARLRDQALVAIAAGIAYLLVAMPANFIFLYLHGVGGVSLRSDGAFASLLGGSQLLWSVVLLTLPQDSRTVRMPFVQLRMSRTNALGLTLTLAANALFGILLPIGGAVAWVAALALRGSYYVQHSLGSSAFSDVIDSRSRPTLRMTGMTFPVGLGAMAAPIAAGWAYAYSPAYPFWISGAACAVAAVGAFVMLLGRN